MHINWMLMVTQIQCVNLEVYKIQYNKDNRM